MLGERMLDSQGTAFASWHAALPPKGDENPDIWLVRGLSARQSGDRRAAARCFWEAVSRVPTHRRANYQLGQMLVALGESSGAAFADRAARLYELTQTLEKVLSSKGRDEAAAQRVT